MTETSGAFTLATALPQARDFLEEAEALYATIAAAPTEAWTRPTQFKQWTFDDVVGHLLISDHAAQLAARSPEAVREFFGRMLGASRAGQSMREYTSDWLGDWRGRALLERWREGYRALATTYAAFEPERRFAWAGPDMSARSFMSARQMETWAHGQAVYDLLGLEREERDRLRNVAVIGINTFGWSFKVHGRDVPSTPPYVRLTAPSGALWEWNDPASADRIEGSAVDFCRVVTQIRNVRDTALAVTGPVATEWMSIAQCFAGPPETPPAPGTRFVER